MQTNTGRSFRRISTIVFMAVLVSFGLVMADSGANHQTKQTLPIKLGTSGGNVNDRSRAFCCSGTLGALVTRSGQSYILSNNHVLGLSGLATTSDNISQPGLVDVGCNAANTSTVAQFSEAPALGSANVDAALAVTNSGLVDPSGEIIDVGIPASTTANATIGLQVAKSGRTTGLTCGNVTSTNTDVQVRYQAGCGKGKKFRITYIDQVVVGGGTFSAGGDSGSLIVSASTAEPVALLFAGSSTTTIGNPVQDVVNALGISFVGGSTHSVSCAAAASSVTGGATASRRAQGPSFEKARAAKAQYAPSLMEDDAVLGVGVGMDAGESVVVIYVEQGRSHRPLPQMVAGVRTVIVRTDAFQAYGWNEKLMPANACKAR